MYHRIIYIKGILFMKKNYKMILQYDGTRYYGWQRQPDRDTIQGKLEAVLSRLCGEFVEVLGAGRTDAGVHAKGMVASATFDTPLSEAEIQVYCNRYLPDDIAVKELKEASPRFHARYNAVGKTYCYTCYDGAVKSVFDRRYYYRLDETPDLAAMQAASRLLIGQHDFRNFCVNPRMKKSTVREVDSIRITRRGSYLYFEVHGSGFLQNMVRIMVGTLLEVGYGRISEADISEALVNPERRKAGPTAPAQGLCLMKVDY